AETFVATINIAFPLFPKQSFANQLENEVISDTLASVIYGLSAKIVNMPFLLGDEDVDSTLSNLRYSTHTEVEQVIVPAALNQWRAACLLAWYGFHQHPGPSECVHMAGLVRKAYQCGLHQIDSAENRASFGWDQVSEERLHDWRHVWWCLYMLDCYASYSTATPHQAEAETLRTALLQTSVPCGPSGAKPEKFFLPADQSKLWKLIDDISRTKGDNAFSLCMAISAVLREAVTLHRQQKQNPGGFIPERISVLEDHLSAIELAMPPNYMRQTRDVLRGESNTSFHYRLLTLLKIYCTRLVLRLASSHLLESPEWEERWHESLEICYRMFAVIQQWDKQYMLATDPAICFIILPVLTLLHLHSLSSGLSNPQLKEQLARRKNILRLFVQNSAEFWTLPRILLSRYDVFVTQFTKPLSADLIRQVLNKLQSPLHPDLLGGSPARAQLQPPVHIGSDRGVLVSSAAVNPARAASGSDAGHAAGPNLPTTWPAVTTSDLALTNEAQGPMDTGQVLNDLILSPQTWDDLMNAQDMCDILLQPVDSPAHPSYLTR
ncbi:hypothetical protein Micbo1qcDRAFT_128926, partial [Microdochium bolleyi]